MGLEDAQIKKNKIVDALLKCDCGNSYEIKSGILCCIPLPKHYKVKKTEDNIEWIGKYIESTNINYLSNFKNMINWSKQALPWQELTSSTILEFGIGWGVLVRSLIEKLDKRAIYYGIDNNYSTLVMLKTLLSEYSSDPQIVLVYTDEENLPFERESFDLIIDALGSTSYNFNSDNAIIDILYPYLKASAYYLGGYIFFENFSPTSQITLGKRKYYKEDYLLDKLDQYKLNVIDRNIGTPTNKGGPYDIFFNEDEYVNTYTYLCK